MPASPQCPYHGKKCQRRYETPQRSSMEPGTRVAGRWVPGKEGYRIHWACGATSPWAAFGSGAEAGEWIA